MDALHLWKPLHCHSETCLDQTGGGTFENIFHWYYNMKSKTLTTNGKSVSVINTKNRRNIIHKHQEHGMTHPGSKNKTLVALSLSQALPPAMVKKIQKNGKKQKTLYLAEECAGLGPLKVCFKILGLNSFQNIVPNRLNKGFCLFFS